MVGVVPQLGGQVEGGANPVVTSVQQKLPPPVGIFRRPEARI